MKTVEEILKQEPVYMNEWKSKIDLISDFDEIYLSDADYNATESPYKNVEHWTAKKERMKVAIEKWTPINILFASYCAAGYEGDAFVLFEQEGKLYEVNGGHCSCYGLEGQFEREETTIEALGHRLTNGKLGNYSEHQFFRELKEFLGITENTGAVASN